MLGFLGGLAKIAVPGVGGYLQAREQNKAAKGEAALDAQSQLEEQLMLREREKRDARNDAYRNSIMASLASNWRSPNDPRAVRFGGIDGPGSDMSRMAGGEMFGQSMRRMLQPDLVSPGGMPAYQSPFENPAIRKLLGLK